jgi:isoamylase
MVETVVSNEGSPLLYGANETPRGINFAVFCEEADAIHLCVFDEQETTCSLEFPIKNKTGKVWHTELYGLPSTFRYGFLVQKHNQKPVFCFDPYAKELNTPLDWGQCSPETLRIKSLKTEILGYTSVYTQDQAFDWEGAERLNIPREDLIIYEMHIRGFTQDPSSKVQHPGKFLGVIEKIPYLKNLGINAVEILPCFEFNENEYKKFSSETGERLYQYWGYSTMNFFSPMKRYAVGKAPGAARHEFKQMVKALHQAGIEVILDVVYNHTFEGGKGGPEHCYKTLGQNTYYIVQQGRNFANYSGCGNSINANHPMTRQWITNSLKYWVSEMRVDGFRFDLASILTRAETGAPMSKPPIIDLISKDPVLSNSKLIAEPWDAGGLYQVGNFPLVGRWSEWNGQYRDCVRNFIKGGKSERGIFATRWCGSEDLYGATSPLSSVNFITAHDGFTLNDLVSYNHKHNLENGENNHDGTNDNASWNCGVEGKTEDADIKNLRNRLWKNYLVTLLTSQGIPMLLMGDEYKRSQEGNNNTWCLDTQKNWFRWDLVENNQESINFYKKIIQFRKEHPVFKQPHFLGKNEVKWCNSEGKEIKWNEEEEFLGCFIKDYYLAFYVGHEPIEMTPPENYEWSVYLYTQNHLTNETPYNMDPYSILLLKK